MRSFPVDLSAAWLWMLFAYKVKSNWQWARLPLVCAVAFATWVQLPRRCALPHRVLAFVAVFHCRTITCFRGIKMAI
jgi:hypothetical protein